MNKQYKLLVIGTGAREHAIGYYLAKSKQVSQVFITNHPAASLFDSKIKSINIKDNQIESLIEFVKENQIDFSLVGPEVPLSIGIVDAFNQADQKIIGPSKKAAQLESSKSFAKEMMKKYQIPTASFECFRDIQKANQYLETVNYPIVIKANGLAQGKGVVIAQNLDEAKKTTKEMLTELKFNQAGQEIVIEQFLVGEEASFMVMVDESGYIELATSQDHKRQLDGDFGPNTGGMGAYSPAPVVTSDVRNKVISQIIEPILDAMKKEGYPFSGFLYAGLMIDKNNNPYVVEFNTRLGDPETQPVLMRLDGDDELFNLCLAAINHSLKSHCINWSNQSALCVVMASKGYPSSSTPDSLISGLEELAQSNNQKVFLAAAKLKRNQIFTAGGRVLSVCALGKNIKQAKKNTYQAIKKIKCDDLFFRTDIGHRAIAKLKSSLRTT